MNKKIIVSLIIFLLVSGGFFIFLNKSDILSNNPFLASLVGSSPLSEEEFSSLKEKIAFLEESLEAREVELENLDDLIEKFDEFDQKITELEAGMQVLAGEISEVQEQKEIAQEEELEEEAEESEEEKEIGQVVGQKLCEVITGIQPLRNKLIINEIAWMGTTVSATNEWIELKNISGQEINLNGWQIQNKDQKIKIIFSEGRASANSFLLLERTNDDSVPGIKADLIYTGALKNENEAIYLFDENCQFQDEALANPDWPAGDNSTKRTMERKIDLNWQTSLNPGGTPKAENSSGYVATPPIVTGGGGAPPPPPPSYPKLLISEIQISGQEDQKEEFVEIYNSNETDVSLNEWYLQRKTKTASSYSSFATSTLFSGKQIKAKEHFLIARESSSFADLADIITDNPLTEDNVLVLKNPNGEIVDKVGWGQAQDFETAATENPEPGKSLARIWNLETQEYQDIDNNSLDFKIQEPTPKEINQLPEPEPEPEPSASNLLLNEFFDDGWEGTAAAGNPVNWTWGKRGGLDFEDPPLVAGKKSFYHEPYSSFYDLAQLGKTLEVDKTYYAEIWVKGTGKVKLGIDHSDTTEWLAVAYTDFANSPWTKMAFSIVANANTNNGGIRIRMMRLAATDERLVIGAAWLSTNPPPENWLFQ